MKKLLSVCCGIMATTAVLSAQTPQTPANPTTSSTQTTTTRQASQPVTITGCVTPDVTSASAPSTNPRFMLSNIQPTAGTSDASRNSAVTSYILMPGADVNLSDHLNHKVQITGTIDSSSTTTSSSSQTSSPSTTATTSSSTQSSSAAVPSFRVTSVKMLSETCP